MFSLRTKISMLKAILNKNSPFYVQFFISNKCFLHCRMCNIVQSNSGLVPFEHDKIDAIARNLRAIGCGVVLLTGGEPFMRDDISDIVRAFKCQGLDVRLQTAGFISRFGTMMDCAKAGAGDINISLDTLDEPLGDYINGVKGSWNLAIRTIAKINREFPPKGTVCALGCVLSPLNMAHVEAVLDFASAIGWWLSLVPAHISRQGGYDFRGVSEEFTFTPRQSDEVAALIDRLKAKKRQGALLFDSDVFLDSIKDFVRDGKPSWRAGGVCDSPNLYFAIRPDGSFAPCCDHELSESIYVYDLDFPKRYKSGELRDKVRKITAVCPGCNYGSYPEMTLAVRSPKAFWERFRLQFRTRTQRHESFGDDEILELIEKIKGKHPEMGTPRSKE